MATAKSLVAATGVVARVERRQSSSGLSTPSSEPPCPDRQQAVVVIDVVVVVEDVAALSATLYEPLEPCESCGCADSAAPWGRGALVRSYCDSLSSSSPVVVLDMRGSCSGSSPCLTSTGRRPRSTRNALKRAAIAATHAAPRT